MANTITNFLVGLGLDTTDFEKGAKQVDTGIGNIKSSALQLAALGASAFGAQQLTFGFAQATDQVGKFSRVFSILPDDVTAFGRALEHEGGTLAGFMSQIASLDRMRAMTPDQVGGLFARAGIVGVDPSVILNAENATEAYLNLADVFASLSQKQRLNAAELFGMDEASIRLLSAGRSEVEKLVAREKELRPITESMTTEAARFNDVTQDLKTNISSVADTISMNLLPGISSTVEDMNSWLEVNKQFINSNINSVLEPMEDNIAGIAAAGGLLASGGLLAGLAGVAKHIPLIGGGLAAAATAAARLTAIGAAATGAVVGADVIDQQLQKISGYEELDAKFTKLIFDLTGFDVSRGNVFEGQAPGNFGSPNVGMTPPSFMTGVAQSRPTPRGPVQVNLVLDGQVIDQRIIDVTEGQYEDTINDITSSTGG